MTYVFVDLNVLLFYCCDPLLISFQTTAAVAQWVRELAPQAEGWVFESRPRQTHVVNTGR